MTADLLHTLGLQPFLMEVEHLGTPFSFTNGGFSTSMLAPGRAFFLVSRPPSGRCTAPAFSGLSHIFGDGGGFGATLDGFGVHMANVFRRWWWVGQFSSYRFGSGPSLKIKIIHPTGRLRQLAGGHPEQHALPLPACFGDVRWRNDQVAPVEWGSLAESGEKVWKEMEGRYTDPPPRNSWRTNAKENCWPSALYTYIMQELSPRFWVYASAMGYSQNLQRHA